MVAGTYVFDFELILHFCTVVANQVRHLLSQMLVIDPEKRISVDDALLHPYVNIWYKERDVNVPVPRPWDHSITYHELTIDQWKELIFQKIETYGIQFNYSSSNGGNLQS